MIAATAAAAALAAAAASLGQIRRMQIRNKRYSGPRACLQEVYPPGRWVDVAKFLGQFLCSVPNLVTLLKCKPSVRAIIVDCVRFLPP